LGKPIYKFFSFLFSVEVDCDVFAGIEGATINESTTISINDIGDSYALKLSLKMLSFIDKLEVDVSQAFRADADVNTNQELAQRDRED
jgi:hypothetical protein